MEILVTLLVLAIWTGICAYGIRFARRRKQRVALFVWWLLFIVVSVYFLLSLTQ